MIVDGCEFTCSTRFVGGGSRSGGTKDGRAFYAVAAPRELRSIHGSKVGVEVSLAKHNKVTELTHYVKADGSWRSTV